MEPWLTESHSSEKAYLTSTTMSSTAASEPSTSVVCLSSRKMRDSRANCSSTRRADSRFCGQRGSGYEHADAVVAGWSDAENDESETKWDGVRGGFHCVFWQV